jgi:hypothetical protein
MDTRYNLPDEKTLLLVEGGRSFVLAGLIGDRFSLCLETATGEICTTLERSDVVAVSAPEGGPVEPAFMLLELVRTYRHPVVVMPRGHPGSRRLRYLVSCAPEILLSCAIQRGSHPEQHLLCSSDELAGTVLSGGEGSISVRDAPASAAASLVHPSLHFDRTTSNGQ